MKLVDILAREFSEWPEGAAIAVQDRDGEIKFGESEVVKLCRGGHTWIREGQQEFEYKTCRVADDRGSSIVTRAEWQAAVDALNAPKVVEWDGVGLPPVGAVCDVLNSDLGNPAWERCTILYSGKHRVMYDSESCEERVAFIESLTLRKARTIRTPEQVAAEEREKARTEVLNAMTANGKTANEPEALWQFRLKVVGEMLDMGYRKDTKPCGS